MARRKNRDLHGAAPDRSATALLILDMISDFEFKDGARMFRASLPAARRIARLKAHAAQAGIPTIKLNDNAGRWQSDFPALVRTATRANVRGAPIAGLLAPQPGDYCVLKPKHSGFFATPLGTLLEYLETRVLILTGVSSNQCIRFTANDAYVRDFELRIPRDCVAAQSDAATRLANRYFRTVLGADLSPSAKICFAFRPS